MALFPRAVPAVLAAGLWILASVLPAEGAWRVSPDAYGLVLRAARAAWAVRLAGHPHGAAPCVRLWILSEGVPARDQGALEAQVWAEEASRLLVRVGEALGLAPEDVEEACRRAGSVWVVVYPGPEALARHFGLEGVAAEGAYQAGVAGVVEPGEALAHELAHFLVEARSSGRAPAWVSEGLAQWADVRLSGYAWEEWRGGTPYTLEELEREFDRLDPWRAYPQALAAVRALERQGGPGTWVRALRALDRGVPPRRALEEAAGLAPGELARWWEEAVAKGTALPGEN